MRNQLRHTAGMTLLETIMVTLIFTVILGLLLPLMMVTQNTFNDATLQTELDMKAVAACDEIANQLKDASLSYITSNNVIPANGTDHIIFQQSLGYLSGNGSNLHTTAPGVSTTGWRIEYKFEQLPGASSKNPWCISCYVDPTNGGSGAFDLPAKLDHVLSDQVTPLWTPPAGVTENVINKGFNIRYIKPSSLEITVTIQQINFKRRMQNANASTPAYYTQYGSYTTVVNLTNP